MLNTKLKTREHMFSTLERGELCVYYVEWHGG